MKAFAILASTVMAVSLNAGKPLATYNLANACPGISTSAEVEDGGGCYVLNVTFVGRRPSDAAADKASRAYLASALKRFHNQDVLVANWFRVHAKKHPYDDEQIHPYPGWNRSGGVVTRKALIYRSKTGKTSVE